jgi:peptidylprolyl isomerase
MAPRLAPSLALLQVLALAACASGGAHPAGGVRGESAATGPAAALAARPAMPELLAAAPPEAWRPLDPARTVYLDLQAGRVVIELASAWAPSAAANVTALLREAYFDGLTVYRVQDGFVAQWGDADGDDAARARPIRTARRALPAEFERPAAALSFTALPDGDVYAPEVGFSDGFPAARDPRSGQAWLVHCYGAVGVGRDEAVDSGSGAELYAVIGHAPRQLDRNITVVGRVVQGIELLSALPRGPAPMGIHDRPALRTPIVRARLAADLPPAERLDLEVLRTEGPTFAALVESRRNRAGPWYVRPVGRIDVCNVPLPVRVRTAAP